MWFFIHFESKNETTTSKNKGHTSVRSYIYPPLTLSVHSIRIFSLDFKEKIEIFIFLWFLGIANVLKILDTKNHMIIPDICVWKKIHKKIIATYHFELVWTPTAGRGRYTNQKVRPSMKIQAFFDFRPTFSDSKIYLYLVDFKMFWFSEKLWVWKARKNG